MFYDIVIIGAGISGTTLAERYATQQNKRVLVIEKRDHIGGNCYDFFNKDGILVSKYGAHLFHTNFEDVWEYVNKFSEWRNMNTASSVLSTANSFLFQSTSRQ